MSTTHPSTRPRVPSVTDAERNFIERFAELAQQNTHLRSLLVECREYLQQAEHKSNCQMGALIMEVGRCTCGKDALLSQLNALLTPTNDQR